jgi:hypothetical protein
VESGKKALDEIASHIKSEISKIKSMIEGMGSKGSQTNLVDVTPVISMNLDFISKDVQKIVGGIPDNVKEILELIRVMPDKIIEVDKIVEVKVDKFVTVPEIVEVEKIVPVDKIVEVEKVVTVEAEKVKKWNFEVIRENGLIKNVIGTAEE